MRTLWLAPLSLLAAACGPDIAETTTATTTTATTGIDESTTGHVDPTTDTGDASSTSDASSTTGEAPAIDCPDSLPPPIDCEPVPGLCGGATPIAGGPAAFVRGSALTRDDVWFILDSTSANCPEALYRVAKSGGDAHRVHEVDSLFYFEADDDAVYLVKPTGDPLSRRISALVDGVETVIGETHGDPEWSSSLDTNLVRTRAGVITYSATGPKYPGSSLLTPTAMLPLASVTGAWLGTAPAHDGDRLYFGWSDHDDEFSLDRKLIGLDGETTLVLADNATPRTWPTVAVDADHVYFATGDPTGVINQPPEGMGVSRVPKTGGPATPLFPPAVVVIDQVLVDDTHVYFRQAPGDIYAVAKAGGPLRHVWHGDSYSYDYYYNRVHLDADALYFSLQSPGGDIPLPGRDFVVRVAKDTAIP